MFQHTQESKSFFMKFSQLLFWSVHMSYGRFCGQENCIWKVQMVYRKNRSSEDSILSPLTTDYFGKKLFFRKNNVFKWRSEQFSLNEVIYMALYIISDMLTWTFREYQDSLPMELDRWEQTWLQEMQNHLSFILIWS